MTMPTESTPTRQYDILALRLEWSETFEGQDRAYLRVIVEINQEEFPTNATDMWCLSHSVSETGLYDINTCTCGSAGCADIWNGIFVRHEPGTVIWYAPDHDGGEQNAERTLRHRVYHFDHQAYKAKVISCLESLSTTKRRNENDVLVTMYSDASEFKEILDVLLIAPAPPKSMPESPQDRLWTAVRKSDITGAQCALADGADLLLGSNLESPWDRALIEFSCGGVARPNFLTELALYLPSPVPDHKFPDYLLDQIVDDGPAELLYRITIPGGPIPLTDERALRCRERLERLRPTPPVSASAEDLRQWKASLNARREHLELAMKFESLERSIRASSSLLTVDN